MSKVVDLIKDSKALELVSRLMSDEMYLKLVYRVKMGKKLALKNPKTFNEKLQWLKLNDRKDIYTEMVDKAEAKNYVANIIGKQYIIPTIGVYDNFSDIDFGKLPKQFVMKCTHDSGGIVICKDKSNFNIETARKIINKCLKSKFYYRGREWPYKDVKPRIIVEKYMSNSNTGLDDYKVHCFNGEPKLILVCKNRYDGPNMTEDFFNEEWKHLDIRRPKHANDKAKIEKPKELSEMLSVAKSLSKGMPFARIDFYAVKGKLLFGEITLFPASGFERFIPEKWDEALGMWIELGDRT